MVKRKAKQVDLSGGPLRPVKVVKGQQRKSTGQKFRAVTSNRSRRPPQKPAGSQADHALQDGALPASLPPGTGFRLIVAGRQRHPRREPDHGSEKTILPERQL